MELACINIEHILELRAAQAGSGENAESKKTPNRSVRGTFRRNRGLHHQSQREAEIGAGG